MRWLGSRVSPEGVKPCLDLLKDQVESAGHYEYPLLISMLQLMTCLTEQNVVSSHLPLETIQRWMEISNWLIRSTRCRGILTHVAKLLRAVIKIKNVTLLIEVYRFSLLVNCLLIVFSNSKSFAGAWHRTWTIVLFLSRKMKITSAVKRKKTHCSSCLPSPI